MKRLLFIFLASLLSTAGALADAHWSYTAGQYSNETFVFAKLLLGDDKTEATPNDYGTYEFAAFIGDEIRGLAEVVSSNDGGTTLLKFRVEGDATEAGDLGKAISFKVYNTTSQNEYDLTLDEPLPQFTGETLEPGIPSNPLSLYLIEMTSMTISDAYLNIDDVVDMRSYMQITPANANWPNNIGVVSSNEMETVQQTCYELDGYMLTAIGTTVTGVNIYMLYNDSEGELQMEMAKVYVMRPATGITQNATETTVSVGDQQTLKSFLDNCLTLSPSGSTDLVEWTSTGDAVAISDNGIYPAAVGDAVLTGRVYSLNGILREAIDAIEVTIHVVQPVTSITSPYTYNAESGSINYIHCSAGDDLTPYLVDGVAFSVGPEDAASKAVTITYQVEDLDNHAVTFTNDGKIIASEDNTTEPLVVTSVTNPDVSCVIWIYTHNEYKTITATQEEYNVLFNGETVDLTEMLNDAFVFGPESAQLFSGQPEVISNDPDVVGIEETGIFAYSAGVATITMSIPVINYLGRTFNPDEPSSTMVSASFDVIVSQGLTSISVMWPESMTTTDPTAFCISPLPEGSYFNEDATVSVTCVSSDDGYTLAEGSAYFEDNLFFGQVSPTLPGYVKITVTYTDGDQVLSATSEPIEVGYHFSVQDGWQWKTIPYGAVETTDGGLEAIFGANLVEVRTQADQLYNDPEYGYFGSEQLLSQNRCFKVKMQMPNPAYEVSYDFFGGSLSGADVTLRQKWNYLPNPCACSHPLTEAFTDNTTFAEGDRIVSQTDGFAEYADGAWTGNLSTLLPGQGYLFYNAGDANRTISIRSDRSYFENAISIPTGQTEPGAGARHKVVSCESKWKYNPRQFRDNMTIVAVVDGQTDLNHCSLGAFVGGECRGEGVVVGDRLFVTVYADAGEQISFLLHNEATGEMSPISQTVSMQPMLGTVKAPLRLHKADATTTGINIVEEAAAAVQSCDLSGRATTVGQKGISIQRFADGSVRKVVRR